MKILCKDKIEKLHRRDALKMMSLGGASILMGTPKNAEATTKLSMPASQKKAKIVIVGGGTGGMIATARMRRAAPNAQIIMIAPNAIHLYQPGQLLVAAGLEHLQARNMRKTADLLPDNVTWMQESVLDFDPENNALTTQKSGKVTYDILIVALGLSYDYERIEGLQRSMIGTKGISSVYLNDTVKGTTEGGFLTNISIGAMRYHAEKRPASIFFTQPDTPIKAEGTSISMLMMGYHFLKTKGVLKNAHFTLAKAENTLFPVPSFAKAIEGKLNQHKNIDLIYGYHLKAIDPHQKIATFEVNHKRIEKPYDFIHITPAMQAPKVLRDSPLAIKNGALKGWMDVDEKSLHHPIYKNVFGIGDALGLAHIKSGGAVAHQAIVLQDNIASALEEKTLPNAYDGYTVSPIITEYGEIMMAEFNKKGLVPTLPIDSYESRWIWWYWQTSFMRRAYFNLLMKGMM